MKNQKVRKAIIPAAGLGTRFLPATKALAKEMLPIVDKPTIQFIVEEALKSGIEDILVVTGKSKRSIEDHFDSNFELEYNLEQKGKTDLLKLVNDTTAINLHFIRQSHPRGLGDAVLQAKAFVGNEPFVVMLGDDLMDITNDNLTFSFCFKLLNHYTSIHCTKKGRNVSHSFSQSSSQCLPSGITLYKTLTPFLDRALPISVQAFVCQTNSCIKLVSFEPQDR